MSGVSCPKHSTICNCNQLFFFTNTRSPTTHTIFLSTERKPVDVDEYGNVLVSAGKCTGNDQTFAFAMSLIAVNGLVLLLSLFQAYEARTITSEYSESTYIGYAMVSMFQLFLLGAPLLFAVKSNQTTFFYACLAIIVGTSFTVLGFMFVPKMNLLRRERSIESTGKTSSFAGGMSGRVRGSSVQRKGILTNSTSSTLSSTSAEDSSNSSVAAPASLINFSKTVTFSGASNSNGAAEAPEEPRVEFKKSKPSRSLTPETPETLEMPEIP